MNTERNCQFCRHYKNGYCEELELIPSCPKVGCDYFEERMINIQEMYDKIKDLSERVENIEKQIIESKKEEVEKLKAELDYAKFRCALPIILNMMSDN